ncbi:MAG TPA: DoxX family protein [Pyrinomonadaceae bacterium]
MTYALWIVQALLALLFLFAGGTKLVIPPDVLASMGSPNQIPLPGWFVRFIGVAEVLGALGLLLPGLLRVKPWLTPLAAAGLVIIMIGATALTMAADGVAAGVVPLVVGLLAAFVAYGRWRLAPHAARREMIRRRSS